MKKGKHIVNTITVVMFVCMISVPVINGYLGWIPEAENDENRQLIVKPEFDINRLDGYTDKYNQYYTDHFSLRTNLITLLNRGEYMFFGNSAIPGLTVAGDEGWFYAAKSRKYYENAFVFSDQEVEQMKEELQQRSKWCEERGIKYYLVVVPNKMNIYPEHLPRTVIKKGERGIYDQVVELDKYPGIEVIGVKQALLDHKKDKYLLYQKTDDHWTEYGAYFGYREIMQRLHKDFEILQPIDLDQFRIQTFEKEGNLAKRISLHKRYPEAFVALSSKYASTAEIGKKFGYTSDGLILPGEVEIVRTNKNGAPLKCMVIRDSFTLGLIPFLQEHFSKLLFIHDEWRYRLRQDIIENEKPDIVITVVLESHVEELLNNPSF